MKFGLREVKRQRIKNLLMKIPMDKLSRSLFAHLMNATAAQPREKTHASHTEEETDSTTAA